MGKYTSFFDETPAKDSPKTGGTYSDFFSDETPAVPKALTPLPSKKTAVQEAVAATIPVAPPAAPEPKSMFQSYQEWAGKAQGAATQGLIRGVKQLKQIGYGLGALELQKIAENPVERYIAKKVGIHPEQLADDYIKKYVDIGADIEKNNPATIGSYKNIHSLGDAGTYAIEAIASNAPMMIPSLLTGGVGAIAARTAAKRAVEGMVGEMVAKGVAQDVAEKQVAQIIAKRVTTGSLIGAAPSSIGLEQGSIYGDIYQKTGEKRPGTAEAFGTAAGLFDIIPDAKLLTNAFGAKVAEDVAGSLVKRLGVEGAKQFWSEGWTEATQALIENGAVSFVNGKTVFNKDTMNDMIDSFLQGGIAGGIMGAGGEAVGTFTRVDPKTQEGITKLQESAVEALNAGVDPDEIAAHMSAQVNIPQETAAMIVGEAVKQTEQPVVPTPEEITQHTEELKNKILAEINPEKTALEQKRNDTQAEITDTEKELSGIKKLLAETEAKAKEETNLTEKPNSSKLNLSKNIVHEMSMSSHSPEKAVAIYEKDYQDSLASFESKLAEHAKTPEQKAVLKQEMERFTAGFKQRTEAMINARAKVASPMVVGPAKFNYAKNDKRNAAYQKKSAEINEYLKNSETAIRKKLEKQGVADAGGEKAVAEKRLADALKVQDSMKKANVIVRNKKLTDEEKIAQIAVLPGMSEKVAREVLKPDFANRKGFPSFKLTSINQQIKRMQENVAKLETAEVTEDKSYEIGGTKVVESHADDRIRIMFDGKLSAEMIAKLKQNAFKWSPKNQAWQRQLTPNARTATQKVLEPEKPAEPEPYFARHRDELGRFARENFPPKDSIAPSVVQVTRGDEQYFMVIPKDQLEDFKALIDSPETETAQEHGVKTGESYHLTAKSPEQMLERGFTYLGVADIADVTNELSRVNFARKTELTTTLLEKLKGRDTVSRQFIADLTKSADMKQAEKTIINSVLEGEGDKVNVPEFVKKVKTELLPLKVTSSLDGEPRYYQVNLPDEQRGPVYNYEEKVYQSPIKTSAGNVHFSGEGNEKYFAHTRVEDMARGLGEDGMPDEANGVRRVLELQSDLFQKGRLESESDNVWALSPEKRQGLTIETAGPTRAAEVARLEPYRNTWQDRIIREEVAQAAKDGKTKLQFPTGETAMKIEGLGQMNSNWFLNPHSEEIQMGTSLKRLTPDDLKVGEVVGSDAYGDAWVITNVLGNGKFRAIPKNRISENSIRLLSEGKEQFDLPSTDSLTISNYAETFDISGFVDKENPIYKFYEKEVAKYLRNKYGAKLVTDAQGVTWNEVDITPDMAGSVTAFAKQDLEDWIDSKISGDLIDENAVRQSLAGFAERLNMDIPVSFYDTILTGEKTPALFAMGEKDVRAWAATYGNQMVFEKKVPAYIPAHEVVHYVFNNLESMPEFGVTQDELLTALNDGKKPIGTKKVEQLKEELAHRFENVWEGKTSEKGVLGRFFDTLISWIKKILNIKPSDNQVIQDFYDKVLYMRRGGNRVRGESADLSSMEGVKGELNFGKRGNFARQKSPLIQEAKKYKTAEEFASANAKLNEGQMSSDNRLMLKAVWNLENKTGLTVQQQGMKDAIIRVAKEQDIPISKDGNLVLYHGTKVGRAPKEGDMWRVGSYFTSKPEVARQFAGQGEGGAIKIMRVEVPPQTIFNSGDGTYFTLNEPIPVRSNAELKIFKPSQLTDIWKQAHGTNFARKDITAEEFDAMSEEEQREVIAAEAMEDIKGYGTTSFAEDIADAILIGGKKLRVPSDMKTELREGMGAMYMRIFRNDPKLEAWDSVVDTIRRQMNDEGFTGNDLMDIIIARDETRRKNVAEQRAMREEARAERQKQIAEAKTETEKVKLLKQIEKELTDKLIKKRYTLKQYVQAIERGKKIGYKQGQVAKRLEILDELRVKQDNIDALKRNLVDYVKANLPMNERGKFLSLVRTAKTQQDLVKAYARIDRVSQEIVKKSIIAEIKNTISRIADAKNIAVDYKGKIMDLMESFTLSEPREATLEKLRRTQEYFALQKKEGKDVVTPERVMKQLAVLSKKTPSSMTVADVKNLLEQIQLLEKLGETKLRIKQDLYDAEKAEKLAAVVSEMVAIEKNPIVAPRPGEKLSRMEKLKNLFPRLMNFGQHIDLAITPMDVFFDLLGGGDASYSSAPYRIFKRTTDHNYSKYLARKDEMHRAVWAVADELKLNDQNFERIGIYAAKVQEGGIDKLLATGLTEDEIENITLTDEEMRMYSFMREKLDAIRPAIATVMRDVYNQELGEVKNYFSFITDFKAMDDAEVYKRMGDNAEHLGQPRKNPEQGFTIARTGGKQRIKLNAMEIFMHHTDNASYLIDMARDNRMLYEIANSPEYKEAAGEIGAKMTMEWVDLISRKGGKGGDQKIAVLDMLRRNMGIARLGFKLSSAIIQPTALMDGATLIGHYAFTGASDITTSRDVRKFVLDNMPEVKNRVADDPAFLDFSESETMRKVQEASYWALKKLDAITASSIAWGGYLKKMNELGLQVDLNNPNAEALEYAQQMMRRTQSSSIFKDVPLAVSKGELTGNRSFDRALLQFQTFMLNRWSLIRHDMYRAGIRGGVGADKNRDFLKAFSVVFFLAMAYLAEEGLRRASQELVAFVTGSKAKYYDGYTHAVAFNVLQGIPFIGQGVSAMTYGSEPIPALGFLDEMYKGVQGVGGKHTNTKIKGLIHLAETAGLLGGIPGTTQAGQAILGTMK